MVSVPYQVQSVLDGGSSAWPTILGKRSRSDPHHVFLLGRQYEQRVDASALRADEGRGIAAISVGEPRAGIDPTISEWGNPIVVMTMTASSMRRAPGELKHLMYPEEEKVFP